MGKYMRKRKTRKGKSSSGVLDSVTQLGVHTRAKTLALQQLKNSNSPTNADGDGDGGGGGGGGGCYLELRSRKLEKKAKPFEVKRRKHPLKGSNLQNPVEGKREIIQGHSWNSEKKEQVESNTAGVEASFGENLMEFERTTRESTPCSLIRDPDNIQTPGSSTRRNNAGSEANSRMPNSARRNIPTTREMNDFFAGSEKKQQKQFIEKYNFDPVNDKPLPGRYEWVKLDR